MAIATYDDLVALVPQFLFNRTDLAALIPDFLTLAQAQINTDLSTVTSEAEASLVAVVGSRSIDISSLPMREPRGLWLTTYGDRDEIRFMLPELLPVTTTAGQPQYWGIDGPGTLAFDCPADQAYTLVLRYVGDWQLSASVQTNYLLTHHPGVYLYGVLMEAAPYLGNSDLMSKWTAKYMNAVKAAQRDMGRLRNALATSSVDPALLHGSGRSSRIFQG